VKVIIMTSFSSVESLLAFWEVAEYIGTTIVVLGVIGELIAEHDWPKDEVKRKRLTRYSTWILIAGLAIEAAALVRSNQLSGHLIAELHRETESARAAAKGFERDIAAANARAKKSEASIADAGRLASLGKAEAAKANERAAKAEKEAARLNKVAEEERLSRIRIEERLRPRRLSPLQKEAIRAALSPLGKVEIGLMAIVGDAEATRYAEDFYEVLVQAGWQPSPIDALINSGTIPSGLVIKVVDPKNLAAIRLQQALKAQGIEAPGEVEPGRFDITLLVCVKP
jgi:hypothetical protein